MDPQVKRLKRIIYADSMELTELIIEKARYGNSNYIEKRIKEVSAHMEKCSAELGELQADK